MPNDAENLPFVPGKKPEARNLPHKGEATPPSAMPPPLRIKPGESLGEFTKRKQIEDKRRKVAVQRQAMK